MLTTVRSFDLVLLEEGEDYIKDAACNLYSPFPVEATLLTWPQFEESLKNVQLCRSKVRKGRIRLGTKSLIFEPDALDSPILKLHFQSITSINDSIHVSRGIFVTCTRVVSVPTTIYNGKTRFLSSYDIHTVKGATSGIGSSAFGVVETNNTSSHLPGYIFIFSFATNEIHDEQLADYIRLWGSYRLNIEAEPPTVQQSGTFSQALIHPREKPLLGCSSSSIYSEALFCWRLKRMVRHGGFAALTDRAFYFQPSPNFSRKSCKRIAIDRIICIFKRDSGIASNAESATSLEIISLPEESLEKRAQNSRKLYSCIYLEFKKESDREWFSNTLKGMIPKAFYALESRAFRNEMTQLWRRGVLPNFQYIDFLNSISGRSRYDMSHYPIFPWVLSDYESPHLDLSDPKSFRDLSKPIGALNLDRLSHLKKRMSTLQLVDRSATDSTANADTEQCNCGNEKCEKCMTRMWNDGFYLYCSHYSTPALVVFFLIRLLPECQLRLYGGKFDAAARTFKSMAETFHNVLNGHSTFFELIPEFYSGNDTFLRNQLNITTQDGRLSDVELPLWAGNSPAEFMKIMRNALESEYVSKNIHEWIDLIFGYKQTGMESIRSDNTFHPLSYLSSVRAGKLPLTRATQNLLKTMEPKAVSVQVREFGQAPILLFENPHPQRLRHPQWQPSDDPIDSAPWFIYVNHHSEIFGGGALDGSDNLRLSRTIAQGCSEGYIRSIVEDQNKGKLLVKDFGSIGHRINGVGFVQPDIFYSLSSKGKVSFHHFDYADKVMNASVDRNPLICATVAMGHLCVCSTGGWMTLCNMESILSLHDDIPHSDTFVTDEKINLGHGDTGILFYRKKIHSDGVSCLSFSDGVLTSGGFDETVKQFRFTNSEIRLVGMFDEQNGPLASLSCVSGLLLTATVGGSVTLWDPRTPHIPIWNHEISNKHSDYRVISCGISNRYIQLVSNADTPVLFWDVRMLSSLSSCGGFKQELSLQNFNTFSAICDPNDCVCIGGLQDGEPTLHIFDLHTKSLLTSKSLDDIKYPAFMSANEFGGENRLLVANTMGNVKSLVIR